MAGKPAGWLRPVLIAGFFGTLVWLERRRPLRAPREPKLRRTGRNLAIAALGGAATSVAEAPVVEALARRVESERLGLLQGLGLPPLAETAAAIALMDYTLYLWHVLTHKLPFLWRFHVVHHIDRDLDASTALRFHAAELVLSVPWRAAQVRLIGVTPRSLHAWQSFLFLSILFHHSNVRLPIAWERRLNRFLVTPRMHGIHHSEVREETDSNWSSGLTLWDWLHGTLRRGVPQDEIRIGVPGYSESPEVGLGKMLALPFQRQRESWRLPGGDRPRRARVPRSRP
jgi:sterol desaturase/sphingolipid hydroxylase (fatty acid hydroxylase superfamily)